MYVHTRLQHIKRIKVRPSTIIVIGCHLIINKIKDSRAYRNVNEI